MPELLTLVILLVIFIVGGAFVDDDAEVANLGFGAEVGAALGVLLVPLGGKDDLHGVVDEAHLEDAVYLGGGGEGGGGVDFDEPGLEVRVDHDVVAVELEAVAVVHDLVLN